MRYEVTLRSRRTLDAPQGTAETVIIEAESGDEAADKAFKPYHVIVRIIPATDVVPAADEVAIGPLRKKAKAA